MNLESDKRLNIQLRLDFSSTPTGEARQAGREDIESPSVVSEPERPANTSRIMEEICERANLKEALRQVRDNKGSAGVDRMTVDQLGGYLKQRWLSIREQLLNGTYEPAAKPACCRPLRDSVGAGRLPGRFPSYRCLQRLIRRLGRTLAGCLSPALEHRRLERSAALESLYPTHTGRSRFPYPEESAERASDLAPARGPRSGPYPRVLSRLRAVEQPRAVAAARGSRQLAAHHPRGACAHP